MVYRLRTFKRLAREQNGQEHQQPVSAAREQRLSARTTDHAKIVLTLEKVKIAKTVLRMSPNKKLLATMKVWLYDQQDLGNPIKMYLSHPMDKVQEAGMTLFQSKSSSVFNQITIMHM
jgi:hypothetical protein